MSSPEPQDGERVKSAEVKDEVLPGGGDRFTGSVDARSMRKCSSAVTHNETLSPLLHEGVRDNPGGVGHGAFCGAAGSLEDSESARVYGISSQVLQEGAGETTCRSTREASSELSDDVSEIAESSRFGWALTGDEGRCGPFQIEGSVQHAGVLRLAPHGYGSSHPAFGKYTGSCTSTDGISSASLPIAASRACCFVMASSAVRPLGRSSVEETHHAESSR
jgi:hypothetical protein